MNVCPILGETGGRRFALGASGGRKIVSAVTQIASFLVDFGMSLEDAFARPRIDVSGGARITAVSALAPGVLETLSSVAPVDVVRRSILPYPFACPSAVLEEGMTRRGMTETMSAWGDAVAEKQEV